MDIIKYRKLYLEENWGKNRFYQITDYEMCIGYKLTENPEIFRPIFSYERQIFLDKVNLNIINPYKFWNKIKLKYFILLLKVHSKKIPIDCIKKIIMCIY